MKLYFASTTALKETQEPETDQRDSPSGKRYVSKRRQFGRLKMLEPVSSPAIAQELQTEKGNENE